MTPPTGDQVNVATQALRVEAEIWDAEAGAMERIRSMSEGLRLNRVEAGIFQLIVDTHGQVIDQIVQRSHEGANRMVEIGETLRSVADTYDREEAANVHRLKNIY